MAVLFYPIICEYALLYYLSFILLKSFYAFYHLWFSRYKYSNLFLSISSCFLLTYLYLWSRSKDAKSFLNCYNAKITKNNYNPCDVWVHFKLLSKHWHQFPLCYLYCVLLILLVSYWTYCSIVLGVLLPCMFLFIVLVNIINDLKNESRKSKTLSYWLCKIFLKKITILKTKTA